MAPIPESSVGLQFELEQLSTKLVSGVSEISCGGCDACSACSHTGCSGCAGCWAETA